MATYRYTAYRNSGLKNSTELIVGKITAESEHEARNNLQKLDLKPIEIRLKRSFNFRKASKLSSQEIALITRQLATMIAAGVSLEEAIQGLIQQTTQDKIRNILTNIRQKILEGHSFAEALNDHPRSFKQLFCATIAAGEQSGKLDQVLLRLADYTESQDNISQKIQHALIYPSFMLLISLSIISFLMINVVPGLTEAFANNNQPLPQATQALMAISNFLKDNKLILVFAVFFAGLLLHFTLKTPSYRFKFDKFLLKIPILKNLIANINVARYLKTFSILFGAGVDVIKAMDVAVKLITNKAMQSKFLISTTQVKEGISIHQALKNTTWINPMSLHLIYSGEKSGELSQMMDRAGEQLHTEINRLINTGLTLLEPLIIVLMGGMVFFIVMAMLVPIFSMQTLIN